MPLYIQYVLSELGAAALISGSLGLAGTGASIGGGFVSAKKQYKYNSMLQQQAADLNEQAAVKAYDRALTMWNKQNEYNLPANERARLEAAGLNPALMYGSAGSSTATAIPTAPQASGVGTPSSSAFPIANPIEQIQNALLTTAQYKKLMADANKTEAETPDREQFLLNQRLTNELKAAGIINEDLDAKLKSIDLTFQNGVLADKIDLVKTQAENARAEGAKIISELVLNLDKHQREPLVCQQLEQGIVNTFAQTLLLAAQTKATEAGTRLTEAQIEKVVEETKGIVLENKDKTLDYSKKYYEARRTWLPQVIKELYGKDSEEWKSLSNNEKMNFYFFEVSTFVNNILSSLGVGALVDIFK